MIDFPETTPELLTQMQQALIARDVDDAERIAEVISVREPDHEDVVGLLVARALARGNHWRAMTVARDAVNARPDSARLQFHYGLALNAGGNPEGALQAFWIARAQDTELLAAPLWQADCEQSLGRDDDALCSQVQAVDIAERSGMLTRMDALEPDLRARLQQAIGAVDRARKLEVEPS